MNKHHTFLKRIEKFGRLGLLLILLFMGFSVGILTSALSENFIYKQIEYIIGVIDANIEVQNLNEDGARNVYIGIRDIYTGVVAILDERIGDTEENGECAAITDPIERAICESTHEGGGGDTPIIQPSTITSSIAPTLSTSSGYTMTGSTPTISLSGNTTNKVCATYPSFLNETKAIFTPGSPTTDKQSWQNTNPSDPCYYSCKTGYSGTHCGSVEANGYCNEIGDSIEGFTLTTRLQKSLSFNVNGGHEVIYQRTGGVTRIGGIKCNPEGALELYSKKEYSSNLDCEIRGQIDQIDVLYGVKSFLLEQAYVPRSLEKLNEVNYLGYYLLYHGDDIATSFSMTGSEVVDGVNKIYRYYYRLRCSNSIPTLTLEQKNIISSPPPSPIVEAGFCPHQIKDGYEIQPLGNEEDAVVTKQTTEDYFDGLEKIRARCFNSQISLIRIGSCDTNTLDGYTLKKSYYGERNEVKKMVNEKVYTGGVLCTKNGYRLSAPCIGGNLDGYNVPDLQPYQTMTLYRKSGTQFYKKEFSCTSDIHAGEMYHRIKFGQEVRDDTACDGGSIEGFSYPIFNGSIQLSKVENGDTIYATARCRNDTRTVSIFSRSCIGGTIGDFEIGTARDGEVLSVSDNAQTMTAKVRCSDGVFATESLEKLNTNKSIFAVSRNQEDLKSKLCIAGYTTFRANVLPIGINSERLFIPITNPQGNGYYQDYRTAWWGYIHYGTIVDMIVCK